MMTCSKFDCASSARQSCVAGESPPACPRVAMLRMNTRSSCELIMVARSPSNAPSPTTLGSCDKIAILPFGFRFRKRNTSSSISVVLPAPPGPMKPITLAFSILDFRFSIFLFGVGRSTFAARVCVLDSTQPVCEFLVGRFWARSFRTRFAVTLMNKFHHFFEGCAGEKNFLHAFAFHDFGVVMRNGAPAAAENLDVVGPFFAEKIHNLSKKLDVSAVITGDADGAHVFLDRRAHDVTNRAVITEVNHFNAMPDEFQVDCIDRAIVPVANWDSGQNSNRRSHLRI